MSDLDLDAIKKRVAAATAETPAPPEGRGSAMTPRWQLVPVEPIDQKMEDVGGHAYDYPSVRMDGPTERGKRRASQIFDAMCAAAPPPPIDEMVERLLDAWYEHPLWREDWREEYHGCREHMRAALMAALGIKEG